jgi:hypothetical protein
LLLSAKKIIHSKSKKQCAASAWATKSMTEKTDCNTTRAVEALALCGAHCAGPCLCARGWVIIYELYFYFFNGVRDCFAVHHGQREHLFFTASLRQAQDKLFPFT